jgi:hypothetical protein
LVHPSIEEVWVSDSAKAGIHRSGFFERREKAANCGGLSLFCRSIYWSDLVPNVPVMFVVF